MADYPEHEKLQAVQAESQAQGQFVDWLRGSIPDMPWFDLQAKLAEYHGIDLQVLEAEKQAMLAAIRKDQP